MKLKEQGAKPAAPGGNGHQKASPRYSVSAGKAHPLGATVTPEGVNFSVFSRHATAMELLIFDEHDHPEPVQTISLDAPENKSFFFWHVFVHGLKPGAHYAYRVDGPDDVHGGHRFDRDKALLDPYGLGSTNHLWDRGTACGPGDNVHKSMRSVVIDPSDYDWEGDRPIGRPMNAAVIYEMHIGGFTKHPSSGVKHPGTFAGVVEKIPYLKELGVTTVELLPVFEFDDTEILHELPDGRTLTNYWGYSTVSFFAPHRGYCCSPEYGEHLREFRDMVKALHTAGIGVVLDVVFNHTSEGNHLGPMINFRGFDNLTYYHLVPGNEQYYMDYSGCGNTLNCNHPVMVKFILECLEFWVKEMHVDGFRFDEGSILSRDVNGVPMEHAPILWNLDLSETFAESKLIAEAWDAAGLYQVGRFPGYRWSDWNGRFRDDVRRFVKGEPGLTGAVATRIAGSPDLYQESGHLPVNSVNFVTAHDGFTLNDLVSYNEKHNWDNGENNNDGVNDNDSWNCGVEGETDDPAVEWLREQQIKNLATIFFLSRGVPMMVAGDEVRRTQRGNNNGYCQDNELSWFDWSQVEAHGGVFRFFKEMIRFRREHPALHSRHFFGPGLNARGLPEVGWHGCKLNAPGWNDPGGRVLAFTLAAPDEHPDIHVILNMYWEALPFELPSIQGRTWRRFADTSLPSPEDIAKPGGEVTITGSQYVANPRSAVVLLAR